LKQLEYWKEGEQRIKLGEIESQILKLSNAVDEEVGNGDEVQVELSAGEKVYRNDVVSTKTHSQYVIISLLCCACFHCNVNMKDVFILIVFLFILGYGFDFQMPSDPRTFDSSSCGSSWEGFWD